MAEIKKKISALEITVQASGRMQHDGLKCNQFITNRDGKFFSWCQQIQKDKTQQLIYPTILRSIVFYCQSLKQRIPLPSRAQLLSKRHPPVESVTCSFIIMNTNAAVYFGSLPNTPFCCHKHSQEHQMHINPSLKIVHNKCTTYSHLRNVYQKQHHPLVLGNNFF